MIRVNLLPPEYRKAEGTPIVRFVALTLGVFLTATAMSVWGYVHFGMLAEVRDRRAQMEEEVVGLQALAERSQALLAEFKEYQRRRETIEEIDTKRILWSRKLDQLADLIHNKGDSDRHFVWLSDVRSAGGRMGGSGGMLQMSGWSGGNELESLADFNEDVRDSGEDFFDDFMGIDPPRGDRVRFSDGRLPALAWRFSMGMDLKPFGWREKQ
jgi:Tfp pilus assembly protein PilN